MARYAGIKNDRIHIVSDHPFESDQFTVLEIPSELDGIAVKTLVAEYKVKDGKITANGIRKKAKDLKVAFVSNYGAHCGISIYAENLFPEIIKYIGDYKLFIEKHQAGDNIFNDDKILECWERGKSLQELVSAIKEYNPDIILINHEFGIFPNARYFLAMISQLSEYRIITIMHSIFPKHKDKTICEAAMGEIVVHHQGAKECLKNDKRVPGCVSVIYHGCVPCVDKSKLWNMYKSDHTIVQSGFLFPYKGFGNSIKAVSILKTKYPDVFFTALLTENQFNKVEHQRNYEDLAKMVNDLGLQDNVALIRGYQSDETLDCYLRTNSVALFPYVASKEHEVWGASGAARTAMSKGIPVISSSVNHFSDLPTIKANAPQEMAMEIDKLFSNQLLAKQQVERQCLFLEENSWENQAKKFIELFELPEP